MDGPGLILDAERIATIDAWITEKEDGDVDWIMTKARLSAGVGDGVVIKFAQRLEMGRLAPYILHRLSREDPVVGYRTRLETALAYRLGVEWRYSYRDEGIAAAQGLEGPLSRTAAFKQVEKMRVTGIPGIINKSLDVVSKQQEMLKESAGVTLDPLYGGPAGSMAAPYVPQMLAAAYLPQMTLDEFILAAPLNNGDLLSERKYIWESSGGHQTHFWTKLRRYLREAALYIRSRALFDDQDPPLNFNEKEKAAALWRHEVPEEEPTTDAVQFLVTQIRDGKRWVRMTRDIGPGWLILMASGSAVSSWRHQELNDTQVTSLINYVLEHRKPLATWSGTWGALLLKGSTGVFIVDGVEVVQSDDERGGDWRTKMRALVRQLPTNA